MILTAEIESVIFTAKFLRNNDMTVIAVCVACGVRAFEFSCRKIVVFCLLFVS